MSATVAYGAPAQGSRARAERPKAIRLAAFAGLAALAASQWAGLLADPSAIRFALVVLVAVGAAAALLRLGAGRLHGPARGAATSLVALLAAFAGLVAIGIPAAQLLPWNWGELASTVDVGIAGLRGDFDYPLEGASEISRALLVAALPVLLALATVLGFRPGRPPDPALGALGVLIATYAIPATARPTESPLLWGFVLLVLTCFWLWGPRLRGRASIALIVCVGVLAVPTASSLARDEPVIDYRDWTLSEPLDGIDFGWDQTYGPIDWPRTGTPLFQVTSDQPRYWRAQVLDEFYAISWRRSSTGGGAVSEAAAAELDDDRWVTRASFSVLGLDSSLVLSPGRALAVGGLDSVDADADGTLHVDGDPLSAGSEYSVSAYAPDPSAAQMRAASRRYSQTLAPYTELVIPFLPPRFGEIAVDPPPVSVPVPLWGGRGEEDAAARTITARTIAASPYRRVARLARRLSAGQPSGYDAVKAIEGHLRSNYDYDESPPLRDVPLSAFLFRDRSGYCQQFSGAMALMLRMSGIPARVAAGFTPGTPVQAAAGERTFEVTDLDAHAWVEVYFSGIGWVPFDPTPADAPAESQSDGLSTASAALGLGAVSAKQLDPSFDSEAAAARGRGSSGGPPWILITLVGLAGLSAGAVAWGAGLRSARHRRLPSSLAGERELRELGPALRAAGWKGSASQTLLELEGRLRGRLKLGAASYVRRLRELRYRDAETPAPTLAERRATRRELASGAGMLRRLRLLWAMPPGGPKGKAPS